MKKIPYYRVKNGRAYFQLGKIKGERVGMKSSYDLGADNISSRRKAYDLYCDWQELSGKAEIKKPINKLRGDYVRGSVGHWWARYRTSAEWGDKKPATRKEWEAMWKYHIVEIKDIPMDKVSTDHVDRLWRKVENEFGEDRRWRMVKIARALWNEAIKRNLVTYSPWMFRKNKMPKPRNQIWFSHEIASLVDAANSHGYSDMGLAIRILWETLMSPVDVRTLPISAFKKSNVGFYMQTTRAKTGRDVYAYISDDLGKNIIEYIESLPDNQHPSSPILRTSRDRAAYRKARFTDEFRKIRELAFGKDEKRQMRDIRRSGNVEADLGGANSEDRAEILANTLHKDASLDATYTPPTVAKARKLAESRRMGREILYQESRNVLPCRVGNGNNI